jgi:hypothetical protein
LLAGKGKMHTSFLVEHEAEAAERKRSMSSSPAAAVRFEAATPRTRTAASLKKMTLKERINTPEPDSEAASLVLDMNDTCVTQVENICFEDGTVATDDVHVLLHHDHDTSLTAVSVL